MYLFWQMELGQKVLKVKKSIMFHIFTSHVAKNGWKKPNSHNFVFSRWKMGGSQAGVHPISTFGLDGYPCFRPPHFSTRKTQNYCSYGFSNHCPQLYLEKCETTYYLYIFLLFLKNMYFLLLSFYFWKICISLYLPFTFDKNSIQISVLPLFFKSIHLTITLTT